MDFPDNPQNSTQRSAASFCAIGMVDGVKHTFLTLFPEKKLWSTFTVLCKEPIFWSPFLRFRVYVANHTSD